MTIKNLADLAKSLGTEPSIAAISRAVYKATECGAWVAEDPAIFVEKKTLEYQVRFRDSIGGPLATGWRRGGRGDWQMFTDPSTPKPLIEYLGGERFGNGIRLPDSLGRSMTEVVGGTAAAGDTVKWQRKRGAEHVGLVSVEETVTKPGIAVGSIVEGSDADAVTQYLSWPFTGKEFDAAVAAVEESADEIWNATHSKDGDEADPAGLTARF